MKKQVSYRKTGKLFCKKVIKIFFHNKLYHQKQILSEIISFCKKEKKTKKTRKYRKINRENPFNYTKSHIGKSCQKSSKISESSR